jgi:outer membrane receptor protein involved in Fe transport
LNLNGRSAALHPTWKRNEQTGSPLKSSRSTLRQGRIALLAGAAFIAVPSVARAQQAAPPAKAPATPIVVTGTRRGYDSSIDRRTYTIGKDIQAANGSIADVLRNIPSVDVDLQGNVSLRGDTNVTILVDGKPTSLFTGPGGGQTLQQIPANQYERVEVMTNPSAAFSANGSGGIINLITRKNRPNGATGSLRAAFGTRGRRSVGGSFADKLGKLTTNLSASWRHDPQFSTDVTHFEEPLSGVSSRETTNGVGDLHLWTARAATDLDLGSSNTLSADVHRTTFLFHSNMVSTLVGADTAGEVVRRFDRNGFLQQNRFDTEGSLSFRHDTSGKSDDYSASVTYETTREDNRDRFNNISILPPDPDLFDNVSRLDRLGRFEAKADLTSPRPNDASLQAGVDLQLDRDRFHDLGGFGPTAAAAAIPQPQFTELFDFHRSVGAAYAIYQRPFGDLTAEAGVRLEAEQRNSGVFGTDSVSDRHARLFPSLHVEWKVDSATSLKGSVSTRIQRPDPVDFDPFRRFVDPFHFEAGNPHLKSETTVSFEGGVEHKHKSWLDIATLYYRQNRGGVTDLSEDLGDGVLLTTRENLVGSTQLGLELVANGPLTRTLSYKLSGNAYRFTIDASNVGFGRRSAMIESGKAGLDWQPGKRDLAQINMSLSGKQLLPQGEVDSMLLVNLGYRHQLSQRWFVFLTAQDALHTYKRRSSIETPTLIERAFDSAKTQAAFVGLTYDFGGKPKEPGFDYSG